MKYNLFHLIYLKEIKMIENERLKILFQINSLITLMEKDINSNFMISLLDEIIGNLYIQCQHEEVFLNKIKFPRINKFHSEHLELKLTILDLREQLLDNHEIQGLKLSSIRQCLKNHLIKINLNDFI